MSIATPTDPDPGPPEPRPMSTASAWSPGWIVLPGGDAVHRDDLRPCSCGRRKFAVSARPAGGDQVYCPCCVKPRPGQPAPRVLAWLDAATGRLTRAE